MKADPLKAEEVVLTEKPPVIADNILHMSEAGQELMIDRIGHLSSVVYNIEVEEYQEKEDVRKKLEEEPDEVDDEVELDTSEIEQKRLSPLKNDNLYEKKNLTGSSKRVSKRKDKKNETHKEEEKKESKGKHRKAKEPKPEKPAEKPKTMGDMIDLLDMDYGEPEKAAAPDPSATS